MGIDRARNSYDAKRQYRSVVAQQGRVTVEADVNEGELIRAVAQREELIDIIGPTGTPDDGFMIQVSPTGAGAVPWSFAFGAGTIYVGGLRVENPETRTYEGQKQAEWVDPPDPTDPNEHAPTAGPTTELVYLELVEQEVSAVEDRALREVALGGPDTAGRTRLIQRVHRGPMSGTECEAGLQALLKQRSPGLRLDLDTMELVPSSKLAVGFVPVPDAANECQPIAKSGFLGAENQLIRVQATRAGGFVWGYDNASFVYRIKSATTTTATALELEGEPVDEYHRPRPHQWVEVLRTAVVLDNQEYVAATVGELHEVASYDASKNTIVLATTVSNVAGPQLFAPIWEGTLPYAAGPTELRDARNVGIGVTVAATGAATPGDYWMIGVRPTHPDKVYPARLKDSQPPDGPRRWATSLATIAWNNEGTTGFVHDCRRPFKPLTEDDDLEFHNKHLHGWGVVCGLQVRCMTSDVAVRLRLDRAREWVTVWNGYAINPEGRDIRLTSGSPWKFVPLHLGELAVMEKALTRDANGKLSDGSVSLWIDHQRRFHVEPYQDKKLTLADALEDTLLRDIFDDCVLNVVKFLQGQIVAGQDDGLVGPAAKRMIALLNLLVQLVLRKNTRWIYLSGEPDAADKGTEDAILRELFDGLKQLLASKSFCAMFENVDYPPYNVYRPEARNQAHPFTIFGTGHHARIRSHHRRNLMFTCGGDAKINVYSLKRREILAVNDFPVADSQVQDIAFSADGDDVYAIAWTGNAKVDSTFAVGTVSNDGTIQWTATESIKGLKLVTLALSPINRELFVAARGMGVYRIDPDALTPSPDLVQKFQASGHLIVSLEQRRMVLHAGEHENDPNPVGFTRVVSIDARTGAVTGDHTMPVIDANHRPIGEDLAHAFAPGRGIDELYAIVESGSGHRHLVIWSDSRNGVASKAVDLGDSMACRIAYSPDANWSLITYQDSFLGRAYRPGADDLEQGFHPLQLAPCSLVCDGPLFFVLEQWSNTITVIPAGGDGNEPWRTLIDIPALERYRVAAIAAYARILGRFVQYLKDCACDHLLVDCPDGRGKVYLADVSFKDGAVYQICNFHNRKYVHTFPTVEYWMSLLPVIPLLKQQVEKLCCRVFTDMFDKYVPPQDANNDKTRDFSMTVLSNGLAYAREANAKNQWRAAKVQAVAGGLLARKAITEKFSKPPPGKITAPIEKMTFVNENEDVARKVALEKKLKVRRVVVASDPVLATIRSGFAIPTLDPGDTVDLVTDAKGTVIGVVKAAPEPPAPPSTPAQPATPGSGTGTIPGTPVLAPVEVVTLRRDLEKHAKLVDDMQKEMKELKDTLARLTPRRPP